MPNGHDKNWVRLLAAIDGFRVKHGKWPDRVRAFEPCLRNIRERLFSPSLYQALTAKVQLIADDAPFVAEDDDGNSYSLGKEGFVRTDSKPEAREWLGIEPDLHD